MSHRRVASVLPLVVAVFAAGATFLACGQGRRSDLGPTDAGLDKEGGLGVGFGDGGDSCQGLACKVVKCDGGKTTTLTGKVFDPAGTVPLYNVAVYIPGGINPDAPLPPIKSSLDEGVSCERCAALALNPLVSAITDETGAFTLKNVPVGDDIPVVVQVGKWRRRTKISIKDSCAENKVDAGDLRLPKNGTEGDMPHIGVATGALDSLDCLLYGIGIDESEFVAGDDPSGHVHVFKGSGGLGLANAPPAGEQFWNSADNMKKYDIAMLSCEGEEANENKGDLSAVKDYANAGGRVFATHYHYTWFKNSPDPAWQGTANWSGSSFASSPFDIDTSFPKGQALADWLVAVKASSTNGQITLTGVTSSLSNVNPPSQSWVMKGQDAVKYFSVNAPIGADDANVCGRAVFSDLHLMGGAKEFPSECPAPGALSAQQKAVEFMFFDLSACVQADDTPPQPPQ